MHRKVYRASWWLESNTHFQKGCPSPGACLHRAAQDQESSIYHCMSMTLHACSSPCSVTVSSGACHANTTIRFPGVKLVPVWGCSLTCRCVTSLRRGSGHSSKCSCHTRAQDLLLQILLIVFKIPPKWVHIVQQLGNSLGIFCQLMRKKCCQINLLGFSIWQAPAIIYSRSQSWSCWGGNHHYAVFSLQEDLNLQQGAK